MSDEEKPDELEESLVREPAPQPIEPTEPKPHGKKKSSKKRLFIVLGIILVILIAGGVGAWWWLTQRTITSTSPTTKATTAVTTSDAAIDPQLAKFITPTTGEVWYKTPKPIADPGYLTKDNWMDVNTPPNYFEVGTHGNNVIVEMASQGFDGYQPVVLFERAPDGAVTYISHANANADYSTDQSGTHGSWADSSWSSKVKVDTAIHYDSLSVPTSIALSSSESVNTPSYTFIGSYINDLTTGLPTTKTDTSIKTSAIKNFGASSLVKTERAYVDTGLTAVSYSIRTPIGTEVRLSYTPLKPQSDSFSWQNGIATKGTIGNLVRGCGAVGTSQSRSDLLTDKDFIAIGTSDTDQTLYGFKDPTTGPAKAAYDDYKAFYSGTNDTTIVSFDTFIADHGVFAYKSPVNGWLIYTLDSMAAVGGCGKPVIYLYPTKTESVNVQVGANVTVSDPLYNPLKGWQNVIASPNGQLIYNGQNYSSLFWEGTGFGTYPGISSGTVVPQAKVAETIRSQLGAQGFKTNEVNDFMDYWQSRIPDQPYVRLTWFTTAQLNELAPLSISPKPDTLIRTFLDMRGLDRAITIPAQRFAAPVRTGFTVVEWGGLLNTPVK